MLSQDSIVELSEEFVCVKIDPRETREGMEHKRSQYVPEIVLLDSRQNFIAAADSSHYNPPAFEKLLQSALEENRKRN